MKLNFCFPYKVLEKVTYLSGDRYYICPETNSKLTSVTTILSQTSEEKKELLEWKKRVGEKEAERIKNEALGLGKLMHTHLENYILGEPRPGGNNHARIMAEKMADQIIKRGLPDVDEVWGSEIHLYQPELFAGTADLCGLYKGNQAIMDFKTAKKLRKKSMIEDYFAQLSAYAISHNALYNTDINTGVIFMVTRDYDYEAFVIEGQEFQNHKMKFIDRLETYLKRDHIFDGIISDSDK